MGAHRAQVLEAAGREVVHDVHLVPLLEQSLDDVRADEAGAAGDQHGIGHGGLLQAGSR